MFEDRSQKPNMRLKAVRDTIFFATQFVIPFVFNLLLDISQYEFLLKNMFRTLLTEKQARWDGLKAEGAGRMMELSEVFGGTTPLTRVEKNDTLRSYFASISKQVEMLDYVDSTSAGRKIKQLTQALEEVQEFHQLDNSLQIRQFIAETQKSLKQVCSIFDLCFVLAFMNIVICVRIFSYTSLFDFLYLFIDDSNDQHSWGNHQYIPSSGRYFLRLAAYWQFHGSYAEGHSSQPTGLGHMSIFTFKNIVYLLIQQVVIKLRAVFLKLSTALDLPLVRICLAGSSDLASVSQFYSSELVMYVRKVLQIIPEKMFQILEKVILKQTTVLLDIPTRLDKDKLKDFAQIDERAEVSMLTHSISVFTEGIMMMKSTLVGVMKIDPKQLVNFSVTPLVYYLKNSYSLSSPSQVGRWYSEGTGATGGRHFW